MKILKYIAVILLSLTSNSFATSWQIDQKASKIEFAGSYNKQNFTGIFVYENWSKCSVKCGLGYRFREAVCVLNTDNSIQLPNTYCDESSIRLHT